MKKKWKTRLTAGLLAVMLGCSALFSVQTDPVFAASAKQEETQKAEAEGIDISPAIEKEFQELAGKYGVSMDLLQKC